MEFRKNQKRCSLLEYVELLLAAVLLALLVVTFFVRTCTVDGKSMNQTLENGEHLLATNLFYTPQHGDVIVFHQTGAYKNEPLVKRVIGVAGDVISFSGKTVYVNGVPLDEEYAYFDTNSSRIDCVYGSSVTVPDGYLFVMGDNRNNSLDSRSAEIGFVDERRVLGHVLLRFSPFTVLCGD